MEEANLIVRVDIDPKRRVVEQLGAEAAIKTPLSHRQDLISTGCLQPDGALRP